MIVVLIIKIIFVTYSQITFFISLNHLLIKTTNCRNKSLILVIFLHYYGINHKILTQNQQLFQLAINRYISFQVVSLQCINSAPINFNAGCGPSFHGPNFPNSGLNGFSHNNIGNTYGGVFPISNNSPITPSGISIRSENNIEGALLVTGQLPILAAVAVDGKLPTSGSVGTTYGCGNGNVGIDSIGGNYGGANLGSGAKAAGGFVGPRMAPGCGIY